MKRSNGPTVVQEYARKRQAQLERARHLKETRQAAPPKPKHSNVNDGEDLSAPSPEYHADPFSRGKERIIQLSEARLMRGVKTGIITTSQANQLWQLFCEESNNPPVSKVEIWAESRVEPQRVVPQQIVEQPQRRYNSYAQENVEHFMEEPEPVERFVERPERTEKQFERPTSKSVREPPREPPRFQQPPQSVDFDELPVGGANRARPKFEPVFDESEEEPVIQVQKPRIQPKRVVPTQQSARTAPPADFDDIPIGAKGASNAQGRSQAAPMHFDLEQIKADELEAQRQEEAEKKAQMELDARRGASMPLVPCRECGRSFREDKIQQHVKVCRKVFGTQRRPFDAAGQRQADGADNCRGYDEPSPKKTKKDGPSKWKVQHLQFINAMRSMKQQPAGPGEPVAPPQAVPDLRTECPHCQRKFNPEVADRHIPKCKNTVHKPGPPPGQRRR